MLNGNQTKFIDDKQGIIVCVLIIILFVFFTRFHYFTQTPFSLLTISSDATQWLKAQHHIAFPEYLAKNAENDTWVNWRFFMDFMYQKSIVQIGNLVKSDIFVLNLIITTVFHIAVGLALFYLGITVLRNPFLGLLFALIALQSGYIHYVRYPIFVPKLIGFTLYPILLAICVKMLVDYKYIVRFSKVAATAFVLYPPTMMYNVPVLYSTAFLVSAFKQSNKIKIELLKKYLIGAIIVFVGISIVLLMKNHTTEAAPLGITELYYSNHNFQFPASLISYGKTYGIYVLATLISLTLLVVKRIRSREAFFMICLAILSISGAVLANILATKVDFFRVTWFWRLGYFFYIPATLSLIIVSQRLARSGGKKNRYLAVGLIIGFGISVLALEKTPATVKGAIYYGYLATQKTVNNKNSWEESLEDIISHTKRFTTEQSKILLPPFPYQNHKTDLFDAYVNRTTLLSRINTGHLIVKTPHTDIYARRIKEYNEILNKINSFDETAAEDLFLFLKDIDATHILWRMDKVHTLRASNFSKNFATIVHKNKDWVLYKITHTQPNNM